MGGFPATARREAETTSRGGTARPWPGKRPHVRGHRCRPASAHDRSEKRRQADLALPPQARDRLDGDGRDEHGAGDDELHRGRQREQVHAVGDRADDQSAQQSRPDRTSATEEAGPGDDRTGDGHEQQVAAAGGLVDGGEPRGRENAAGRSERRTQDEHEHPDVVDLDPRTAGRLGIAADREDVAAYARGLGDIHENEC